MAEANPTSATPPAASGANNNDAAVASAIAAALKPINDALKSLGDNQKVLADTLTKLPPAPAASADDAAADKKKTALTLDDVKKLLDDRDAAQASKAQRDQTIASLVKEKLGGKEELAKLLTGNTPDELKASAELLAANLKPAAPSNVGGANAGGGTPPANQPVDTSKLSPTQLIASALKSRTANATA